MRITLKRKELVSGLKKVAALAKNENPLNMFRFVRVDTMGGDSVLLTTCDGKMMATTRVFCKVDGKACVLIPCARFVRFVTALEGDDVVITDNGAEAGRVILKDGRTDFVIHVGTEDIPAMKGPDVKRSIGFVLQACEIEVFISKARYATSNVGCSLRILEGVHFESQTDGDGLVAVGVNGKMLGWSQGCGGVVKGVSFTLPNAAADYLAKLCDVDGLEQVDVRVDERAASFTAKTWSFTTTLVEGEFPAWRKAIPGNCDKVAHVDRVSFAEALARVSLAADRDRPIVEVVFMAENKIFMSVKGEVTNAFEFVPSEYSGKRTAFYLDSNMLKDVVGAMCDNKISMSFHDSDCPLLIEDDKNQIVHAVIMPIRKVKEQ